MKCLIVDEDGVCREVLRETLSPHGKCDTAINAHDALHMFRNALDNRHSPTITKPYLTKPARMVLKTPTMKYLIVA